MAVAMATANVKGWDAWVVAEDSKHHRYATVSVKRLVSQAYEAITGTFEITCDQQVKLAYHKTSFHDWGLADLNDAIWNEVCKLSWIAKRDNRGPTKSSLDISLLERPLRRFHSIVRQLKHRHNDRTSFPVTDEYDVQDLLHAILRGLFDDIRAEEYTPSYAGGAARMDFLLKSEKIVLEIKVTSDSVRDKQIGEQLLIDIGRYRSHPDCERLVCFVYDPHGHLKNPTGLEADLSKMQGGLEVKVIIVSP